MQHSDYLKQALSLAEKHRGFCAPNPAVGAVVVKDNRVIATGEHLGAGHPHAEVMALKSLGQAAKDAVLYVTLEPCCHTGRTPPCTDLIIQSGIQKVIYGFQDPNPKVNQQSQKLLQAAGIICEQIEIVEITQFYESYAWYWAHQLPWVTAKLAISMDGKIAAQKGRRTALTGNEAQIFTHQWRKRSDAILTTAKTILADNPALNVRLSPEPAIGKPVYIIDRQNRLARQPHRPKVFQTASRIKRLYATLLADMLKEIAEDGIQDVWVEAGGQLFSALIQQKLLQRAFIYVAPMTAGKSGVEAFITTSNLFEQAKKIQWQTCGRDVICEIGWI